VFEHCLAGNGKKFHLHSAVIMRNHVHLLLTPLRKKGTDDSFTLAEITKGIKGASSRRINQLLQKTGSIWQDESFDRVVRTEGEFESKMLYIMENPVAAGLVRSPHDYPWYWSESTQHSVEMKKQS
jgi:REP element-mobilizing transposase RayT